MLRTAAGLDHQAGQTVDRAFEDGPGRCQPGDRQVDAGDPLGALDRQRVGDDESAAVGDRGRVRVEQADQGLESCASQAALNRRTTPYTPYDEPPCAVLNAEPQPGRGTVLLLRAAIGF